MINTNLNLGVIAYNDKDQDSIKECIAFIGREHKVLKLLNPRLLERIQQFKDNKYMSSINSEEIFLKVLSVIPEYNTKRFNGFKKETKSIILALKMITIHQAHDNKESASTVYGKAIKRAILLEKSLISFSKNPVDGDLINIFKKNLLFLKNQHKEIISLAELKRKSKEYIDIDFVQFSSLEIKSFRLKMAPKKHSNCLFDYFSSGHSILKEFPNKREAILFIKNDLAKIINPTKQQSNVRGMRF